MVCLGLVKEIHAGERRVALSPASVARLKKLGFDVLVEAGAGAAADFTDAEFTLAGAQLAPDPSLVWGRADWMLKVNPPAPLPGGGHEADLLREGGGIISFVFPSLNPDLLDRLAARRASVIAMEAIPRITRAQRMDALSSMANLAGYRAMVEAAHAFDRFITGQITAAGRMPPAKVLVIGAGVAGLAAIGAARGLGAIVRAFDVRAAVRDEIQSMGAEFLEVKLKEEGSGSGGYAREMSKEFIAAEMALFKAQAAEVDIIITTAQIPGKPSPTLLTREIVEQMRPGGVIVDLAAAGGGNCELTRPDEIVDHRGVKIIGYTNMAGRMPQQASELYGRNIVHLLEEMGGNEKFAVDLENEIVRGALLMDQGRPLERPAPKPAPQPAPPAPGAVTAEELIARQKAANETASRRARQLGVALMALWGAGAIAFGAIAPESMIAQLTVFALAVIIGWHLVWNVTPALHTPLMSVTNAISGIIILGGMLQLGGQGFNAASITGGVAVLLAMINISGGFLVTQRMLKMFRKA